jgi:Mrp family chromosome partitioning ATPase
MNRKIELTPHESVKGAKIRQTEHSRRHSTQLMIAIASFEGGGAKTTTAVHLAAYLQEG